jgi:hypothetical protein
MLAVISTAFLVRNRGHITLSEDEWQAAIAVESTIFLKRTDDGVELMLVPKKAVHE